MRALVDPAAEIYDAPPLYPPKESESVLVFPTNWLDDQGVRFQGVKKSATERFLKRLFDSGGLEYIPRAIAEQLDDHKQIVTYIMVTRGREVLSYRRGNYNRVEDFLKGARCIGFGGHVSAIDETLFGQATYGIFEAAARELKEELHLPVADRRRLDRLEGLEIVGLLNDDASANGRRHFAILMRYDVSGDSDWTRPTRNEKAITQLQWLDPQASPQQLFEFEYWSQLCLLEFYKSAAITRPTFTIRRKPPLRPPHVLVVLGELGSGKSATTRVLRDVYSYSEINSGQIVADILKIPALKTEEGRLEFQDKAWAFIERENGAYRLAEALLRRADQLPGGRVLIEGIRQRRTLQALFALAGHRRVGTMFIHTPFNVAFEFYKNRAGHASIYDFIEARNKPVEQEVGTLVEMADAVLYNWSGEREYARMIVRLMTDLGVTP